MAACTTFGFGTTLTPEQRQLGIKSVDSLSSDYESGSFWTGVRQRNDGRANAFGRDMQSIQNFFDRHFWNYDINDPYINYPTDTGRMDHLGRFTVTTVASVPVVGDVVIWTGDTVSGWFR